MYEGQPEGSEARQETFVAPAIYSQAHWVCTLVPDRRRKRPYVWHELSQFDYFFGTPDLYATLSFQVLVVAPNSI